MAKDDQLKQRMESLARANYCSGADYCSGDIGVMNTQFDLAWEEVFGHFPCEDDNKVTA